jgi:non-ribosomal peptide synthase protein (TIGR01720 family)
MFPVILSGGADKQLDAQIISTKEMLRKIPNKGIGYGLLKYDCAGLGNRFSHNERPVEISFNYLGEFGAGVFTERWRPSECSEGAPVSPKGQRPHKLDFMGMIVEGKLTFEFVYNEEQFEDGEISLLAERFSENVMTIIKHCQSKEQAELTPSDVGSGYDLSVEELNDISALLSGKIKT